MTRKPPKFPGDREFAYLDEEERELIESIEKAYERGEMKPLTGAQKKKALTLARQAARNTMKKTARVNVRMTNNDLRGLKAKAAAEGIPYQTLLTALVHKYISGQIKLFS